MVDMNEFKQPVHRSLLQREIIAGVPQIGLLILFILGVILIYMFRQYYFIIPIVLFYFLMRFFTSKDPWCIEMVIDYISQKDRYIP